jgi:hypothetical protein
MPGWTYDDVRTLPRDVYEVLVDAMNERPQDGAG